MTRHAFARPLWTAAILIAVIVAIVLLSEDASGSRQRVVVSGLLYLIVVMGTYIFVGNSGVMSFGHIGLMGVGAYVAAWTAISPSIKASLLPGLPGWLVATELDPGLAAGLGGVAASVVALIFGLPLTRLSGITASIGTFAMLAILQSIFANWTTVTGGQASVYGLPTYTSLTTAGAWASATVIGAALFQASPWGFRLRSAREDAVAAAACGVNVRRERLIAFVVSAFFVGAGGALYAYFLKVVVAEAFFLELTFVTIAMLVIGGMRSMTGAFVGVAFVLVLAELLRQAERGLDLGVFAIPGRPGMREVGLALAMLIALLFRPNGLTGGREIPLPRQVERGTTQRLSRSKQ